MYPSQRGWAAIPSRTNTIPARSNSVRGRIAEMTPITSANPIQRIAPPITSDAVAGAALPMISVTSSRVRHDCPRSPCASSPRKWRYPVSTEPSTWNRLMPVSSVVFANDAPRATSSVGTTKNST